METKIFQLKDNHIEETLIEAGAIIKKGGLVAFPTETVYGLGGDAFNEKASQKIYEAKGRPSDNPLIIHIADIKDLEKVACHIPEYGWRLAKTFWPGPLTLIFNKQPSVPLSTTGGLNTVAVRLPEDNIAREFIKASGGFVAAPSANLSGRPSPTSWQHVVEDLEGRIDGIVLGHDSRIGLESTIIDCSLAKPVLLRPGFITPEDVLSITGELEIGKMDAKEGEGPKAPGMKYKHYAPKGELFLIKGLEDFVQSYIQRSTNSLKSAGYKVGILCYEETFFCYESDLTLPLGKRLDEERIASGLFGALRKMDQEGIQYIFSEIISHSSFGDAIMNRLNKAAGFKVVEAEEGAYFEV